MASKKGIERDTRFKRTSLKTDFNAMNWTNERTKEGLLIFFGNSLDSSSCKATTAHNFGGDNGSCSNSSLK